MQYIFEINGTMTIRDGEIEIPITYKFVDKDTIEVNAGTPDLRTTLCDFEISGDTMILTIDGDSTELTWVE